MSLTVEQLEALKKLHLAIRRWRSAQGRFLDPEPSRKEMIEVSRELLVTRACRVLTGFEREELKQCGVQFFPKFRTPFRQSVRALVQYL